MPTGYTADVADGTVTDFRTFALMCARQFGACIMQRDDPMDEPPKHRKPSTYERDALAKAKGRLAELQAMTVEEAGRQADAEYAAAVASHERARTERERTRRRYKDMLEKVRAWKPPTSEHDGLRKFMIDQLEESIRFDTGFKLNPPTHQTGTEWLTAQRAKASHDIGYYEQRAAEELARVNGANAWIDALYASLPPAGAI